ncbi:MAG: metal-dependent hydrolase [Acidobacteria bacterium]|nr:MAG: metal-dependent hydrolase [Acidobacteriota bacterium]
MATPVGHGLAGLSLLWLAGRFFSGLRPMRLAWLAIFFALLPDFDFLPGLLIGKPAAFHHGISHSLGFGLLASLIGSLSARRSTRRPTGVIFLLLFFCYSSHLLLDYFGNDARPPYGIPVFWPVTSELYLSPIPLFPGVRHVRHTDGHVYEWVRGVFSWHNVWGIAVETLLLLPITLASAWRQLIRRDQPENSKAAWSSWWSL